MHYQLEHLQSNWNNSFDTSNHEYYPTMANKFNSIKKSSKAYWSLLKSFINNKNNLNHSNNSTQ